MFSIVRIRGFLAYLCVGFVLTPFVAGCGGDDGEVPPPAPTPPAEVALTEAELLSEAEGICAEVNAAIGTINASEVTDEVSKEAQRDDIYLGLADRLEDLGEPSDGAAPTEVIDAARELGGDSGDAAALETFQQAAAAYGLTECADDPEAPSGTSTVPGGGEADSSAPTPTPTPAPAPAPAPAPTPDTGGGGGFTPGGDSAGGSGGAAPSGGISPG